MPSARSGPRRRKAPKARVPSPTRANADEIEARILAEVDAFSATLSIAELRRTSAKARAFADGLCIILKQILKSADACDREIEDRKARKAHRAH
jgi:hypothetical protein